MNSILLIPPVLTIIAIDMLLVLFLTLAFLYTLHLLMHFSKDAHTQLQHRLQKRSYLISTMVQVSLYIYIFLFLFFIYVLNNLAFFIPGAMCSAGVLDANAYGNYLILSKLLIIFSSLLWLNIHKRDIHSHNQIYFKQKFLFFLFLYLLIFVSFILEILFFTNLSTSTPVLCCSVLYNNPTPPLLGITQTVMVGLFYLNFTLLILSIFFEKRVLLLVSSIFFLFISYYALTYFFSSYIYELPTHQCPYCLLGSDYYFYGYFIYGTFILANYYAVLGIIFKFSHTLKRRVLLFYTLFVFSVSFKILYYYIVNGTFL